MGIDYEEMAEEALRINVENAREENTCLGFTTFWRTEGKEEPVKVTEKEERGQRDGRIRRK